MVSSTSIAAFIGLLALASAAPAHHSASPPAAELDLALKKVSTSRTGYTDGNGDVIAYTTCGADEYVSFEGNDRFDRQCQQKLCTCDNGVAATGSACPAQGAAKCALCTGSFHLTSGDTACEANTCNCSNGTPASGKACSAHLAEICATCDAEFHFKHATKEALTDDGYSPDVLPLGNCMGDCDLDSHCAAGYVCYQNHYHTVIPGCIGAPKEAMDYCVKETDVCDAHTVCDTALAHETFAGSAQLDRECAKLTTCQPGAYVKTPKTDTSDRECQPCGANTFSTGTNAAKCSAHTNCQVGEFETKAKTLVSNRECDKCAVGSFSDYLNAPDCMACDHVHSFTHQPKRGQSSCIAHEHCSKGKYLVGYSDSLPGKCDACVAGTYKASTGSTPYAECSRCHRGRWSAGGATSCTKCAKGTYQSQYGQASCASCPKGRFAEAEGNTALGHCDYCPSGKYADTLASKMCKACGKGYMGVVGVANDHENHCEACEAGRFQAYDGSTHCEECATGTYSPVDAHKGCLSCDVANGAYTGGKIDENTFYWTANKAGATKCTKHPRDCKPNAWKDNWSTCSKPCGGGTQNEKRVPAWNEWGGGTSCTEFDWEREQDCNEHHCPIDCKWSAWSSWQFGEGGCSKTCGGGMNKRTREVATKMQHDGKECTGSDVDTHDCNMLDCPTNCDVGAWGGWTTCDASCNGGRQSRSRTNKEPTCYGDTDKCGKECPDSSEGKSCQTQCCKGYFHASPTDCKKCGTGKFAPQEGVPTCTTCDVGTYQPAKGAASCTKCPKGRHNTNKGSTSLELHCSACDHGKFAENDGSVNCDDCDAGKFNALHGQTTRDSCNNCGKGQYAESGGAHKCEECAVGQYNDEGATTASTGCKSCAAGRFNKYKGSKTEGYCYFCPCGQWSVLGSSVCSHCDLGTYRACADGAAQCDGGKSKGACLAADEGHRAHKTASCAQSKCTPGKYIASSGSHFCSSCKAGKFSAATGATSEATCSQCPEGQWSSANSSGCTRCAVGKFNKFKGKGSIDYCLKCEAGSYTNAQGSATCEACEIGRFQATKGQTSCALCGEGTSNPSRGGNAVASCAKCLKGHYQDGTGKPSCKACGKGTYQDELGSDGCVECTAGTFNMFSAQTHHGACVNCSPGSYSDADGAIGCTNCGLGRANANKGANNAARCVRCAAGQFADEKAMSECKKCSKGTSGIASQTGATSAGVHCLKCAKGTYQKFDGATTCEKCKADTYAPPHSANHDMIECLACKVVDSVRRYSTFGVAGADHCEPVPVDCKPSPWGAVVGWSKAQHLDLSHPDHTVPSGWAAGPNTWSACTKSCGTGQHTQTRHPLRMPAGASVCGLADQSKCTAAWGGGKACSHDDYRWSQTNNCNAHACPIDCTFTQWGHWEPCSQACDGGGTHRVRAIISKEEFGGKKCPNTRDPPTGFAPCNSHTCSDHPAACGAEHVRCNVLMLEHHRSSITTRGDLTACGHSVIEEQNMCWNNDSCKTCKNPLLVHSNNDHCHKEACHDADTASERAMQDRLQAQYTACLDGADDLRNAARKEAGLPEIPCRKLFPTLQVTHDRENMEQLGKFKCAKDSPTTCSCKCDRHPPCCATKNKLLTNSMVFGNRFTDVAVLQDCCNMCTNHPDCTAWEVCCTLIDPRACALLAATLLPFALRLLTPTLPRRPPFAHSSHRNASASLRVAWFRPAATWPTPCRRRSRRGQALHRAWARAKCCTTKGARRMRTAAPHSVLISSQNHTRHAYAYLLDIRMSTHTEITHAHTLLGK